MATTTCLCTALIQLRASSPSLSARRSVRTNRFAKGSWFLSRKMAMRTARAYVACVAQFSFQSATKAMSTTSGSESRAIGCHQTEHGRALATTRPVGVAIATAPRMVGARSLCMGRPTWSRARAYVGLVSFAMVWNTNALSSVARSGFSLSTPLLRWRTLNALPSSRGALRTSGPSPKVRSETPAKPLSMEIPPEARRMLRLL
mmetsp:Transcript_13174/g.25842  ORF Transcript_13174/g.25842 Transcript_13174/m.25842 type:complete len:203 (+) Transcript_13174:185-793(+)